MFIGLQKWHNILTTTFLFDAFGKTSGHTAKIFLEAVDDFMYASEQLIRLHEQQQHKGGLIVTYLMNGLS